MFSRIVILALALYPTASGAEDDAVSAAPFKPGDVVAFAQIDRLQSYLPAPFWEHRQYFFFEGMQLGIGPFQADYSPSELRRRVTDRFQGLARIGREERGEGWLESYVAGTPFPAVDSGDPDAGLKIAWNSTHRHDPMEAAAHFRLSSWTLGAHQSDLTYQGHIWGVRLANRIDRVDDGGEYFPEEDRKAAGRIRLDLPAEFRSFAALGYRYLIADSEPLKDEARDAWVWLPSERRVRRVPGSTEEEQAIPGTELLIQDIHGFNFSSGLTQKFEFKLMGEADVLTPIDTHLQAFPLDKDPNLGPHGSSFANDVWQLRRTWVLWIRKRTEAPLYGKKLLWVDRQTGAPLYAAAYHQNGELWRLIYIVHRWSESPAHRRVIESCDNSGDNRLHRKRESERPHPEVAGGDHYLYPVGQIVVNVRNGKGSRLEAWDMHATHLRDKDIQRNLASNRLSVGGR